MSSDAGPCSASGPVAVGPIQRLCPSTATHWTVGRGLKRAGLVAPRAAAAVAPALQFVPVGLAPAGDTERPVAGDVAPDGPFAADPPIRIELRRGGEQLKVRWPSSQAASCAAWLSDLAGTALR